MVLQIIAAIGRDDIIARCHDVGLCETVHRRAYGREGRTLTDRRLSGKERYSRICTGIVAASALALLGWGSHKFWITSKIIGTLPWCLYVSAISVALYTLLRWIDKRDWTGWFKPLSPAGTATLTVYMMPYLYYALWRALSPAVPSWLAGGLGIFKCAIFSMLCIATAWLLGKAGLKLKI